MSKLRAVVYLRQSSYKEESISLELQERANCVYAVGQGYEVVAVISDPGISGRTWNRPGVQKVMGMIEANEADVIILWKWSRLSRSRLDWAVAADKVESAGGRIESATEQIDVSTSTGRLARGMLTEFAAFESERIGDTWKETHARRIRNGLPHNAPKHFGYVYDKQTGYTPDEHEGAVLRQLYVRFIAGVSFVELGAYAASEGFEPATGWRKGTIRRFLDKGFGAGYLWVKGELVRGAHDPVISEAEWDAYRVRREERGSRPRAENSDYIYSGLLRCHCGGSMGGGFVRRGDKIYKRYVCLLADQKGTHVINTISEPYVEKAVLAWLENVAAEWDAHSATVKAEPVAGNVRAKLSQIKADLAKTVTRLDSLTVKHLDGIVGEEVYNRLKAKFESEKLALEARQRLLEVNATVRPQTIVPQMLARWADTPALVKRESLRALGVSIHLHDWETESRSGGRTVEVRENWL
jgi:site-specific DNA recombinase